MEYEPGTVKEVQLHDGPVIQLRKLEEDYDPTDRMSARYDAGQATPKAEFITGLIYINQKRETLPELLDLPETALANQPAEALRPHARHSPK